MEIIMPNEKEKNDMQTYLFDNFVFYPQSNWFNMIFEAIQKNGFEVKRVSPTD